MVAITREMQRTNPIGAAAGGLSSCTTTAAGEQHRGPAAFGAAASHSVSSNRSSRSRGRYPISEPAMGRGQRRPTGALLLIIVSCILIVAEARGGFKQQSTNFFSRAVSAVLLRLHKHTNNTALVRNATASARMRMEKHRSLQGKLN